MIYKNWQNCSRIIIHVDMNAFFANVEQRDNPAWQNKPVAVTNGNNGSTIIACSYESRRFGVKTGMRLYDARQLCPHLIRAPTRPRRYVEISTRIMDALKTITPDIEIFSIDEAFLDLSYCKHLYKDPIDVAHEVKHLIREASGLSCSVGVSGDKTTAKFAAKQIKPDGLTVIPPWESRQRLHNVPVQELCGIAEGIGNFLRSYGAYTCGDVVQLPISVLSKRFGNLGRRLWFMCSGADPDPIHTTIPEAKSMGHGKVLPPNTNSRKQLNLYFQYLSERLAARLRRHHMLASHFFVGMKSKPWGWLANKYQLISFSDDGADIFKLCQNLLSEYCSATDIRQVQITALNPRLMSRQLDLFVEIDEKRQKLNAMMDAINARFGQSSCFSANLLQHFDSTSVIAPAWRPTGHRNTIK